jgi:hypothetical protein
MPARPDAPRRLRIECTANSWCEIPDPAHAGAAASALGLTWGCGNPLAFPFAGLAERLRQLCAAGFTIDLAPPPAPGGELAACQAVESAGKAAAGKVVILPAPEGREGN